MDTMIIDQNKFQTKLSKAFSDLKAGLVQWKIWFMMAHQDIRLRYRRSVLGPFWLTLSMAITIYSMGFLYGKLFHMDLEVYYPYLAGGMLAWALISSMITDTADTFIEAGAIMQQIKMPISLYIHRILLRNFFIFFHNVIVIIPILLVFHEHAKLNLNFLLVFIGLATIYLFGFIYGLILSILCARFRDISQIVKSFIQVIFFMTPIMWMPQSLPAHYQTILYFNPFYSLVQLIRAPLNGQVPTLWAYGITVFIILIGAALALWLFSKYRTRIIYWV